jgi:hypothetical protein
MIDLIELITAQRDLQTRLGHNFTTMTVEERITYIREHVLACTDELHEALAETGWKSWATSKHINYPAYFGELRDAWQHLTNLMLIAEPDPVKLAETFANALYLKHTINHLRINNYDGISTKCPSCSRALDDTTTIELPSDTDTSNFRCVCGTPISSDTVQTLLSD